MTKPTKPHKPHKPTKPHSPPDAWETKREHILVHYGTDDYIWLFNRKGELLVLHKYSNQVSNLGLIEPDNNETPHAFPENDPRSQP